MRNASGSDRSAALPGGFFVGYCPPLTLGGNEHERPAFARRLEGPRRRSQLPQPGLHRRQVRGLRDRQDLRLRQPGDRPGADPGRGLRAGRRRRRREGRPRRIREGHLGEHAAGPAKAHHAEARRPHDEEPRGAGAARDARHGQADRLLDHGRHPGLSQHHPVVRRGDRQDLRRGRPDPGQRRRHDHPRGRRRGRLRRAVELPAADGLLEDRPGTGRRQFGDPEAGRAVAADRDPAGRAGRRGRHPRGRVQRVAGLRSRTASSPRSWRSARR